MDSNKFLQIFNRIEHHLIARVKTRPHDNIPSKLRLAIVLEFLASGTICRHMSSVYRVSKASMYQMIDQVCNALIIEFKGEFMTFSNENWLSVANEFNYRWNLPNCIGAIDGRHVPILCPPNSGSLFFNYKVRCLHFLMNLNYIHFINSIVEILFHCVNGHHRLKV